MHRTNRLHSVFSSYFGILRQPGLEVLVVKRTDKPAVSAAVLDRDARQCHSVECIVLHHGIDGHILE